MGNYKKFERRHLGPRSEQIDQMLQAVGAESIDQLIDETIPSNIRLDRPLNVEEGLSEFAYLDILRRKAAKNKVFKTYIGMGYHPTVVPAVIQRNILENPGWYTAYTPYQAEISQGRLEALLNFQTMVSDLTGLPLANASLLDEATAAAEAMTMFMNLRSRDSVKAGHVRFFVGDKVFPQTIEVLKTRSKPLGIELVIGDWKTTQLDETYFGALLQYPNGHGEVEDYRSFVENARNLDLKVAVGTDLLSLTLLTPPGEWGADVAFGNSQRLGVPMGYGGPHAAFFATKEEYKRHIPGRIIGVSKDRHGQMAMRMALQTREQHIKRERATSNICTAQALLAVMASMYAVYHGADGLTDIAKSIHYKAATLEKALVEIGFENENKHFFDTLQIRLKPEVIMGKLRESMAAADINLRYFENEDLVGISLNETTEFQDLMEIINVFRLVAREDQLDELEEETALRIPADLSRTSTFLTHEVFKRFQSETEIMRYMKRLENKDLSLTHSMISLGSCTMKLNAASELLPLTWPEFAQLHPFIPIYQAEGYIEVIQELNEMLCEITGFDEISFQPNSGAQGEYAGLMAIRGFHEHRGEGHRNIMLIPSSAHGTNPASAVMAGMKVVVVKCDEHGNIDVDDLKTKAEKHSGELAGLMVTYPSTHGVFEKAITTINEIVHQHGGQVYMDGANMNAQVGLTNPGRIGADVCHLNLHKTFAIPHGGGGPGMGPIGVRAHLAPFLSKHVIMHPDEAGDHRSLAATHFGSALILLISYGYIKMLGQEGLTKSTQYAILNANYIKEKLKGHYDILYTGENGRVAHEMIVDCRSFKKAGVEVADLAKRLIDYGFHAPTVSFPVAGTMMVEPTESESLEELDRFCDAMISIRQEINEIESGAADRADNVLKNAPHIAQEVCADEWNHSYSRSKAAYPAEYLSQWKYWAPVGRVDNALGDRNLICTCPPMEEYEDALV